MGGGSRPRVRRSAALLVAGTLMMAACGDGGGNGGSGDNGGGGDSEASAGAESGSDLDTEGGGGSGSALNSELQETLSSLNSEMRGADTVITLPEDVLFESGEYELLPEATETLDAIAEAIGAAEGAPVQVVGHTDDVGSDSDNQTLSEQRAQAVVDHLTGAGVDSGQITAEGRGESEPVAPNDSDGGRAQNRRVEIVVEGVDLSQVTG